MNAIKISIVAVFVILSIVILYYGGMIGSGIPTEEKQISEWEPEKVPEVNFKRLDGTDLSLSEFKGKVVMLNFWATWCPPCIKEFPSLLKVVDLFNGRVILVAVSHDDSTGDVKRFLSNYRSKHGPILDGPNVIMAWDKEQKIAQDIFNIIRLPETIILDKELRMVKKYAGAIDWTGSDVTNHLRSLLGK